MLLPVGEAEDRALAWYALEANAMPSSPGPGASDESLADRAWRFGEGLVAHLVAAYWFEQTGGRQRPVVDLAEDLLLADVVVHDVLAGRVGLRGGPALCGGVAVTLAGLPRSQSRKMRCFTSSGLSNPKTCRLQDGSSARSIRWPCHQGSRIVSRNPVFSSAGT